MKRPLCSALIAGLLAGRACAAPADTAPSGIDKAAIDPAVRPQDDFFRYSQGTWLHDVDIPADRASWGAFNEAQENVETQIRTLIEQAAQGRAAKPGSDAQKMGDYYASYVDRARRDAPGLAP
jgi:predicted metalloendopeptidase